MLDQQNSSSNIDVYKNDIDMYMHLWMEERNIDDMCKVSQNRWYNCCKYIYEHVFKDNPGVISSCMKNAVKLAGISTDDFNMIMKVWNDASSLKASS